MNSRENILVVAGEPSGDERAAEVILAIQDIYPNADFFGVGGTAMRKAGVETLIDISEMTVFGFSEALMKYFYMKKIMRYLLDQYQKRSARLTLLIDFGGFNLRLARELKKLGGKVAYYISPQLWASRPGRVNFVQEYIDLMMVLFPFEESFYQKFNLNVEYVGHPLLDSIKPDSSRELIRERLGSDPQQKIVGLMPGSRVNEINRLMPVFLETMNLLGPEGYKKFIAISTRDQADAVRDKCKNTEIKVVTEDKYDFMAASDLLILASGTAALEAAIIGTPSIVTYKMSPITALIAKSIIKTKYASLPNIILDKEVFPELLLQACNPQNLCQQARGILENPGRYDSIRDDLEEMRNYFGSGGAADKAANHIVNLLKHL